MEEDRFKTERVDNIPVLWIEPEARNQQEQTPFVIWLPAFSGTKETVKPYLAQLADAGFLALSFDPWQHGERGYETGEEMGKRVFSNFRRYMWPILGQTTLDTLRIIDWAQKRFAIEPSINIGGFSMGGDIAVAVAGLDMRISRVVAMIATPDWLRPSMQGQPGKLIPPGEPDQYAQFFYDHLNPITHIQAYAHQPAITFESGADDVHIPPQDALRFEEALRSQYPTYGKRLRVNIHPGIGHEIQEAQRQAGLQWLTQ